MTERKRGPKKAPFARRKAISPGTDEVRVEPLLEDRAIPMVVRAKVPDLNLVAWAQANQKRIDSLLWEHRALLFRGFDSGGIEGFEAFVEAASSAPRLTYKDRSTPRNSYGDRIYNATIYPPDQSIRLHNEGSYWTTWALKIFFACITNATKGGQTPIGDNHKIWQRIDPSIREEFERREVLYVRNFNHGFGLTWQDVYQTEEPSELEAFCAANDIEFEWQAEGRLRTRQRRPAVRPHPRTGEPLWFNHMGFFHVTALEPSMRDVLLEDLGEDELPYNTYYGDGAPIDPEVVRHVLAAYEAERIVFRWEQGDVALYDNTRIAHGREPYEGERLTLVAMTEAFEGKQRERHAS